nr:IS21 family transposase [Longispora sp. (in: high G+C Gram-positive bacteria)]
FDSLTELDGAFARWLPIRRAQVHRTHGQIIAVRAEIDRAALLPLPAQPYLVTDKHLRRVGKDCLVSFEASFYSVPAKQIRAGQRVQLQIHPDPNGAGGGGRIAICALGTDGGGWLATHPRARTRGSWIIDQTHWNGLPDGHTRATTVETTNPTPRTGDNHLEPLSVLLTRRHANITVAARPLTDYAHAATHNGDSR